MKTLNSNISTTDVTSTLKQWKGKGSNYKKVSLCNRTRSVWILLSSRLCNNCHPPGRRFLPKRSKVHTPWGIALISAWFPKLPMPHLEMSKRATTKTKNNGCCYRDWINGAGTLGNTRDSLCIYSTLLCTTIMSNQNGLNMVESRFKLVIVNNMMGLKSVALSPNYYTPMVKNHT